MRRFRRPLLIALVVAVAWVAAVELLVDRRLDPRPEAVYLPQADIVVNAPNLDERLQAKRWTTLFKKTETFRYRVTTDADGCRVRLPGTAPPASQVVGMVGGSFFFGQHADYDETFQGRWEKALPETSVVNFSRDGICIETFGRVVDYYRRRKQLKMRALVVGLYVDNAWGDLPCALARQRFGSYKAIDSFLVGPSLYNKLTHSDWERGLYNLHAFGRRHSSTYSMFVKGPNSFSEFSVPLVEGFPESELGRFENLVMDYLEQVQKASDLERKSILIFFVPTAADLMRRIEPKMLVWHPEFDTLWNRIRDRAEAAGYPVVDPRQLIIQRYEQDHIYPYTADWHLNAHGFEVLAEPGTEKLKAMLANP